eukprot:COSAG01_NODE_15244_length_1358_cov_1.036537_2_plen_209_part_00
MSLGSRWKHSHRLRCTWQVHSDFTVASGPVVLRHVLHEHAGRLRARPYRPGGRQEEKEEAAGAEAVLNGNGWRYVFLNVWRSMDRQHPVQEWPLALLHPRSSPALGGAAAASAAPRRGFAIKHKRNHAIFPENYVLRADTAATGPLDGDTGANSTAAREQKEERHEWFYYPRMTADGATHALRCWNLQCTRHRCAAPITVLVVEYSSD